MATDYSPRLVNSNPVTIGGAPLSIALISPNRRQREAAAEILGFYRNYHSIRFVHNTLVVRLRSSPSAEELADLSGEFADIIRGGAIDSLQGPLPAEAKGDDHAELPRIAFRFDRMSYARLRMLIDALNGLPSAPRLPAIALSGD